LGSSTKRNKGTPRKGIKNAAKGAAILLGGSLKSFEEAEQGTSITRL